MLMNTRISDNISGNVTSSIRAHSGEITDIAIAEDTKHTLVASSSRDRTIQLFSLTPNGLDLAQTLDEHAGSVTSLLFAKNGSQLISCSADRTVVVREAVHRDDDTSPIFVITKTITLKNSPTSMKLSLYEDTILLSATDRCIQLINTQSGRIVSSFKAADTEGGEAVIMSSLAHLPSAIGPPIMAGVSSSDKSVRLYSEDGTLLARDWGHTEGVTDIAVLLPTGEEENAKIVTVAADGTIFVWKTEPRRPISSGSDQGMQASSGGFGTPVTIDQPVRKIISTSEIARYQRSQSGEPAENEPPSPSVVAAAAHRAPTTGLRHKSSRLCIATTPRLDPSAPNSHRLHHQQSPKSRQRSPSPPASPMPASPSRTRHPILHTRPHRSGSIPMPETEKLHPGHSSPARPASSRGAGATGATTTTTTTSHGFGSVAASTEQLSRTLEAFRRRLVKTPGGVAPDCLRELERELEATRRLVGRTLGREERGSGNDSDVKAGSLGQGGVESRVVDGEGAKSEGETTRAVGSGTDESAGSVEVSFVSARSETSCEGGAAEGS